MEVRIQTALDAGIVEFAFFVGAAEEFFKVTVCGDQVQAPVVEGAVGAGKGGVQGADFLLIEQALAVGRIGDDRAAGSRQGKSGCVLNGKADLADNAGILRVATREVNRFGVDV